MNKFSYFKIPSDITKEIIKLKTQRPSYWEKIGKTKLLRLVNYTIKNVEAYRNFLEQSNVSIGQIKNLDDFFKLPTCDKNTYLKCFDYYKLFPKNSLNSISTISSTSGSTGEPFYFPRGEEQDMQYEYVAELFLKNQFHIDKKRTLAINGFGLGIWIGGIFTYKNFNKLSGKGYKLAVAPTGTNKEIFLRTFHKMSDFFDQIILMGYPPFIKDVVDEAGEYAINWSKYSIKVLTATEGYSEEFREYLIKKLFIKNRYLDIINIYGSVELGTMSHETPLSNLIRKMANENQDIFNELFHGANQIPTLAQYYPQIVHFEQVGNEVVASGYGSSFPLIRYRFHDNGGVIKFDEMVDKLKGLGVDIYKEAKKVGIFKTIFKLPFVHVYGRSDYVVILRGANIYPENIRSVLSSAKLETFVTGKFCMLKKENKKLEEYLEINIELKKGVRAEEKLKKKIDQILLTSLRSNNSEFDYLYSTEGKKLTPRTILHNYESPKYFKLGIKQVWIR